MGGLGSPLTSTLSSASFSLICSFLITEVQKHSHQSNQADRLLLAVRARLISEISQTLDQVLNVASTLQTSPLCAQRRIGRMQRRRGLVEAHPRLSVHGL